MIEICHLRICVKRCTLKIIKIFIKILCRIFSKLIIYGSYIFKVGNRVTTNDLTNLIKDAFSTALAEDLAHAVDINKLEKGSKETHRNKKRSKHWVSSLSNLLLDQTNKNELEDVRYSAFHQGNSNNKTEFGRNEFLFDIVIAEIMTIESAGNGRQNSKKNLDVIKKLKWVVESEFCIRNSREVLFDLNKLVVAKAENKLLIISCDSVNLINWAKQSLITLSAGDEANIYLASIPHPASWEKMSDKNISVFKIK